MFIAIIRNTKTENKNFLQKLLIFNTIERKKLEISRKTSMIERLI